MAFEVRTAADPVKAIPAVRAAVSEIDPGLPLCEFTTEKEAAESGLAQERLFATLTLFRV